MRRLPARAVPLLAGLALAVLSVVEITLDPTFAAAPAGPAVASGCVVLGAVLASRFPILGAWVTALVLPVGAAVGIGGSTGAGVLGIFLLPGWAGYRRTPRRSWAAPLGTQLIASAGVALSTLVAGPVGRLPQSQVVENLFFSSLCWASWGVGVLARTMRERSEQLARLAAVLDAEREARDHTILVEERQRIAREVHDAVAHNVSVMVLQLGALRSTLPADGRVATTLRGVEDLGRSTVTEMRGVIGILRQTTASTTAPPSLERADELVAEVRAAGLPVELTRSGTPKPLPRALDVSAYRVLQEALTNVLRHAGRVPTTVHLDHADGVTIEVEDAGGSTGTATGLATPGGGHGLVGMRERVAVYGGRLEAGPRAEGGFRVRARFPLPGSSRGGAG